MRSPLLYTASILALLTTPVFAQTNDGAPPTDPATTTPGMGVEAPSTSPTMGTAPDTTPQAARDEPSGATTMGADTGSMGTGSMGTGPAVSVDAMMGRTVQGGDGESLGSVEDVIIDPQSGEARRLVLSSGGFLGIGAKQVAIDLSDANLTARDDNLVLPNLTRADIEGMPAFEMEEGMVSVNSRQDGDATGGTSSQ